MDPNKYFSCHYLNNAGMKKILGMLKNVQFGRKIVTLSPVAYITVDFEKLLSDTFHAGSALVECKSIMRKQGYQNSHKT